MGLPDKCNDYLLTIVYSFHGFLLTCTTAQLPPNQIIFVAFSNSNVSNPNPCTFFQKWLHFGKHNWRIQEFRYTYSYWATHKVQDDIKDLVQDCSIFSALAQYL